MKVTYLHHSGFLLQTESATLLFDYYSGPVPQIPENKPFYVFASHEHYDHFSNVIFNLGQKCPKRIFFMSMDIPSQRVPEHLLESCVFVKADDKWNDDILHMEAIKSTDMGVAFWIYIDGRQIYHAGDLNNWFWANRSSDRKMARDYQKYLMPYFGRRAFAAFIPVDPRQTGVFARGEYSRAFFRQGVKAAMIPRHVIDFANEPVYSWSLGLIEFMDYCDADYIFPMHMWTMFEYLDKLKSLPEVQRYRDRIMEMRREGESVEI